MKLSVSFSFSQSRSSRLRRTAGTFLLGAFTLWLTGCTSTSYRAAPKDGPPAILYNLPSTQPPIEALVHTVIIFRGPGSWKLDAYWDEYVITVANRGNALVSVESATLTDFQNQVATAGSKPWELASTSRTLADAGFGLAKNTVLQIGGGVTVLAAGAGVGTLLLSGVSVSTAGAAAAGGVLLLPAFIGGTIYTNINSRHAIEQEFQLRRLKLPVVLVPGQSAQGSLFFRICPGPQRLVLHCQIDSTAQDVAIDLSPINNLHLKVLVPGKKGATPPGDRR